MDLKKYYDLLEVKDGASLDEIKHAYEKMLRRARHDSTLDIIPINEAYDILTGNVKKVLSESEKNKREKAQQRANKMPLVMMGGVIILVILAILIPAMLKTNPDLRVTFVGNYQLSENYEILEIKIEEPDSIKKVEVSTIFLDSNASSGEADMGGRIALAGTLQSGDADIMIVTKDAFNYLLTDLDTIKVLTPEILGELNISINDQRLVYQTGSDTPYGINLTDITIIGDTVYGNDELILVIAKSTENYEEVIDAIKYIINSN